VLVVGPTGFFDQGRDGGILETSREVFHLGFREPLGDLSGGKVVILTDLGLGAPENSGFEAGKGKIIRAIQSGVGQRIGIRISLKRSSANARSARVGQAKNLGDFVERLANRVITRLTKQLIFEVVVKEHQLAVPTANDQGQNGKFWR
jgi:hypothetical protein